MEGSISLVLADIIRVVLKEKVTVKLSYYRRSPSYSYIFIHNNSERDSNGVYISSNTAIFMSQIGVFDLEAIDLNESDCMGSIVIDFEWFMKILGVSKPSQGLDLIWGAFTPISSFINRFVNGEGGILVSYYKNEIFPHFYIQNTKNDRNVGIIGSNGVSFVCREWTHSQDEINYMEDAFLGTVEIHLEVLSSIMKGGDLTLGLDSVWEDIEEVVSPSSLALTDVSSS